MRTAEDRLDEARAFLDGRFGERATDLVALGRGFWSRAYGFRLDDRDLVVRFGLERTDYEKDRLARTFAGPHLPVPEMVEIGDLEGEGYYAISVRHRGQFLEALALSSAPWLGPALWRMLDALRAVPVPSPASAGWLRTEDPRARSWRGALTLPYSPFAPTVADLDERLAEWPEVADLADRARHTIRSIVDSGCCPELRSVLHADLLHHNVLVDVEARTVSAVLDWGQMAYGDFVFDVAAMAFHAQWFPSIAALDLHRSAAQHFEEIGLDVPDLAMRLHCYEIRVGLDRILSAAASNWWGLLRPPISDGSGPDSITEVAQRTAAILDAGPPSL